MKTIRITKIFEFEMAHALYNHDGLCKNIHGHSYKLEVCVIGNVKKWDQHPSDGMVMDFSTLKKIVKANIIQVFDHALVLNGNSPFKEIAKHIPHERMVLFDCQPTSENLLLEFVKRIQPELPSDANLHHLKLHETATSFAEWYAEDN